MDEQDELEVVVWSIPPNPREETNGYRLLSDGSWEYLPWIGSSDWARSFSMKHPLYQELARRLLAEWAEQEKLDDHNDKAEAEEQEINVQAAQMGKILARHAEIERRLADLDANLFKALEVHARRVSELDVNLAREVEQGARLEARTFRANERLGVLESTLHRLEGDVALLGLRERVIEKPAAAPAAPPAGALRWDRTQGIMVDDKDQLVLDLSDYFEAGNMAPKDHDLLERLADLWSAWGEKGYLRERLTEADYPVISREWFRQLRSELLAVPWLFQKEDRDV